MYIPNDNTQNYPFCILQLKRLDTKLNETTNQNLIKVPKVVEQTNKKKLLKKLGTSVINSPKSPPSLAKRNLLSYNEHIGMCCTIFKEEGDNGLFITRVSNVLK